MSEEVLTQVAGNVSNLINKFRPPYLVVILIGNNIASELYVNNKISKCELVGIISYKYHLSANVSLIEVIELINKLNNDNLVDAILVQLPLPEHLNKDIILNSINPYKDVDGLTCYNFGNLLLNTPKIKPCTSSGVMYILDRLKINCSGKNIVVVGASNLVGKPIAVELINRSSTVTICNKDTLNLSLVCSQTDILIVAIGNAKFIKKNYIKEGALVIDIGINRDQQGNLCGDVDFNDVIDKVSYITPVPGGVGQLTVAMLMKNTLLCYQNNINNIV